MEFQITDRLLAPRHEEIGRKLGQLFHFERCHVFIIYKIMLHTHACTHGFFFIFITHKCNVSDS